MGRLITPEPNAADGGETPPGHGRVVVYRRDGSQQRSLFSSREQALEVMLQAAQEPYNEKIVCNYKARDESYLDSYKFEHRRFPNQGPGILRRIWDKLIGLPIPDDTPSREKIVDTVTEDLIRHHNITAKALFSYIVPKNHPLAKAEYMSKLLRPFVSKYIDANRDFFFNVQFTARDVIKRLETLADTLYLHDTALALAKNTAESMTARLDPYDPTEHGPPGDSHQCEIHIIKAPADAETSTTPSPG